MTDLRKAAQAALVQMDGVWCAGLTGNNARQFEAARDALRAALAVPHVQPSGAAVPVGLPAGEQTGPVAAAPTHLPPLPPPYRPATIANSRNTASVRNSFEMGGYEKSPALFTADQMDAYAREAVAAALAAPQAEILLSSEDQQRFAETLVDPPQHNAAMLRAEERRKKLIDPAPQPQAEPVAFCYLRQTSSDRNPPHGWAVFFSKQDGDVPLYTHPPQPQAEPLPGTVSIDDFVQELIADGKVTRQELDAAREELGLAAPQPQAEVTDAMVKAACRAFSEVALGEGVESRRQYMVRSVAMSAALKAAWAAREKRDE